MQAHAETYTGLVETGVGLIPAWGGCKEMILRYREQQKTMHQDIWFSPANDPMSATRQSFMTIGLASVSKSADDAKSIGYFRKSDGITMNRDRLLADAKLKAIELSSGYNAPKPCEDIRLPGKTGKVALDMAVGDMHKSGKATPHDVTVCEHLAIVLAGGIDGDWTEPVNEDRLLELEYDEFKKLLRNEKTWERIEHTMTTGKPLRN